MPRRKKIKPPPIKRRARLVPRHNEGLRIIRLGQRHGWFMDLYVDLLSMPWWRLGIVITLLYFLSNIVFATFYYCNIAGIENAHPGSFQDVFFFSIQTMATIGYGRMTPLNLPVNLAVSIEALWGFCFFAVTTALVFAKFSQPKARVLFSDIAVITPLNGVPHLMLRLANERTNRIVDAKVELVLLRNEVSKEGRKMRRFYDLFLVRSHVPIMQLTWMVMHPLDDNSPLQHITQEQLEEMEAEVIVSLHGLDETMSQTIYARHSYMADEIICDATFEDVLNRRDDGYIEVNYQLFHTIRPTKGSES